MHQVECNALTTMQCSSNWESHESQIRTTATCNAKFKQCSTMQYNAMQQVHCYTIQFSYWESHESQIQTTCCNCNAVQCNAIQCKAIHCNAISTPYTVQWCSNWESHTI